MMFSRGNRHMATCRAHNKQPSKPRNAKGLSKAERAQLLHGIHNRGVEPEPLPSPPRTSDAPADKE